MLKIIFGSGLITLYLDPDPNPEPHSINLEIRILTTFIWNRIRQDRFYIFKHKKCIAFFYPFHYRVLL